MEKSQYGQEGVVEPDGSRQMSHDKLVESVLKLSLRTNAQVTRGVKGCPRASRKIYSLHNAYRSGIYEY